MISELRNPDLPIVLNDVAATLLPVSATLLGLVYAGLIFWFQGALKELRHTRDLVEDLIAPHGKTLLDLLVGIGLVSLFSYFGLLKVASLMFWLFAAIFAKDLVHFLGSFEI